MISIFSDGLRSVPPGLARGLAGARRQPLAHDLEDRRAHRAPGDRRRHRARHRPRARRGGDAGDGLRLGRLRAQPGRRPDLHLRALAAAGADDRQEHRPAQLAAGQRDPVRDRRGAALLGRVLSLTGWLARRSMRKYGARLMESSVATPPVSRRRSPAPPGPPRQAHGRRSAAWRLSDKAQGSSICWGLGLLFCAIAVAIVMYFLIKGLGYNKLGGLKKQLETLCAQLYAVKDVCSHQYQAMVALVKLKSYGITEEHILHLKDFFERNKTNPGFLAD